MHKLVLACGLAFAMTSPSLAFAATSPPFAFALTSPPFAQDKIIDRLGPVQVNEPVLGNIGPNALIAFYTVEDGKCAVQVLTWQREDTEAIGASRSRLTLNPEQQMNIDSIQDSLTLQCGKDASNIMLIPPRCKCGTWDSEITADQTPVTLFCSNSTWRS
jgi:hypothetical protein